MKNLLIRLLIIFTVISSSINLAEAREPFIGEIKAFGNNFCSRGWAPANGQLLPISQNTALFSLFGCTYGGDCRTDFALPDLRGRTIIGEGRGPGLTNRRLGQKGGAETVTLSAAEIPSHSHNVTVKNDKAVTKTASGNFLAKAPIYRDTGTNKTAKTISYTGSGQAHPNMGPSLTVTYCVALTGIYPSRS